MPVEQDVQLLSDRVRALEARLRVLEDILGGSRIALEAGRQFDCDRCARH